MSWGGSVGVLFISKCKWSLCTSLWQGSVWLTVQLVGHSDVQLHYPVDSASTFMLRAVFLFSFLVFGGPWQSTLSLSKYTTNIKMNEKSHNAWFGLNGAWRTLTTRGKKLLSCLLVKQQDEQAVAEVGFKLYDQQTATSNYMLEVIIHDGSKIKIQESLWPRNGVWDQFKGNYVTFSGAYKTPVYRKDTLKPDQTHFTAKNGPKHRKAGVVFITSYSAEVENIKGIINRNKGTIEGEDVLRQINVVRSTLNHH